MDPKAQKKLEKQRQREELLIRMRKETLAREEVLDEATLKKIKDKWFETVVDTKVPQMQDNLKHILHYMERLIEAESFRKSLFETERDELEEQSTLLAQGHASAMETLFNIYEKRIQDLHNTYSEIVSEKKEQAEGEFKEIEDRENVTQENMHTMLYQMHENREKKEDMMNCAMFLKLDDERSKNTEVKENLRTKLEMKMERRWGEISSVLNKYEEETKARRKDYFILKTKDDADSKVIYQQMRNTQKLFGQLEELRKCMDGCYAPRETISLIADTREEKAKFFDTFKKLKGILEEEMREDEANIKILTVATNSLTKDLINLCTKGEQILTLFRICRRFETELEKVSPVGAALTLPKGAIDFRKKTKPKIGKEELTSTSHTALEEWTKDYVVLEKLWKKMGIVRLSKLALQKCIEKMQRENKSLKKMLASYLQEASKDLITN